MKSGIIVSDVMTRNPLTINSDTNLLECTKKMVKNKVGSFPIVDKNQTLTGFISQKDILWAIIKKSEKGLKKIKVGEISMKKIVTIKPQTSIEEALQKMKKYRRLPVTQNGKLVGMITQKDILNFKPEFYPELEEASKIREETEKLKRFGELKERVSEGICGECGQRDWLYKSANGELVCRSCR
ncbi:MAG: CBS domain-containing protein [Nanoarchaeota archaeon]